MTTSQASYRQSPGVGEAAGASEKDLGRGADRAPENAMSVTSKSSPLLMLSGRVGGAMLSAMTFWVVVILLPEKAPDKFPWGVWVAVGLLALIAVATVVLVQFPQHREDRVTVPGAISLVSFCGLLIFLILGTSVGFITMNSTVKYSIAVGGTALGSLVVGLLLFDTIRAAASMPIVVLFIGTATIPAPVTELAELRPTLITWMAVIIGATAVAESATQVVGSIQKTQLARTVVNVAGPQGIENPDRLRAVVDEVKAK